VTKRGIEVKRETMVSYNRVNFVRLSKIVAGRVLRLLLSKSLYNQPEAFFKWEAHERTYTRRDSLFISHQHKGLMWGEGEE